MTFEQKLEICQIDTWGWNILGRMTSTKVLRKKQAVNNGKVAGDEINEEIKGYQVGFWVCAEKLRNYQKILSLRVTFLGFSKSIPLTAAFRDAEWQRNQIRGQCHSSGKRWCLEPGLQQHGGFLDGLQMGCKRKRSQE